MPVQLMVLNIFYHYNHELVLETINRNMWSKSYKIMKSVFSQRKKSQNPIKVLLRKNCKSESVNENKDDFNYFL